MADPNPFAVYVAPDAASGTAPPAGSVDQGTNPFAQYVVPDNVAASIVKPSAMLDIAKQIPSGLAEGIANIPTAVPRILNAAGPAISSAIESAVAKISPEKAAAMHEAEQKREALVAASHPTSVADYLPQPQTTEGQFARTASEFVPAMAMAPGSMVRNAATGAVSGLASEAGGQATKGTAAEPYARTVAGALGGVTTAGALAPKVAELAPSEVIKAGEAAYKSPEVTSVLIAPARAQKISSDILGELDRSRFNDRLAPQTRAIVEDLATPVAGNLLHTVEDFQTVRQLLGKQAGNFNNPTEQAAASKAIAALDKGFADIPQSDLVSGDIGKATNTLTAGRADYAAGKAAERIQQKLDNAELQTASAHSGGNIDNATRQKLRGVLTNPKQSRGLTPEELDQLDQVVRGSATGNVLRATGKLLGGGGGLGSLVSAAEGMHVAGPVGAAMPLVGFGIKKMGDAITTRRAAETLQQILGRAPSAATLRPTSPQALKPSTAALIAALTGGASTRRVPLSMLAPPTPLIALPNMQPVPQ